MNRLILFSVLVLTAAGSWLLLTGTLAPTARAEDEKPSYIGPGECKSCHFKQHKSYLKTPLARAFDALKPGEAAEAKQRAGMDVNADNTKNPECLRCHTTGYGTETGYPAPPAEGATWSEAEKTRAELNAAVTCEACHGPGSLYAPFKKEDKEYQRSQIVALGAMAPVTADNCAHCHVKECPAMPEDYAFDFEKMRLSENLHEHKELKYPH